MESSIINLLSDKKNNNIGVKEISRLLKCDESKVIKALDKLCKKAIIYKNNSNNYYLVSNTNLLSGKVKNTSNGLVVVTPDNKEYIVINKNKVKHNYMVLFKVHNGSYANVESIIDRGSNYVVGEVIKENKNYMVTYNNKVIYLDKPYPLGTLLLIDKDTKKIIEVVGYRNDPKSLEKGILKLYKFSTEYSIEYLKELKKIPLKLDESKIKEENLVDLRSLDIVTIDGDDTKDFDDAVGFNNNNLYISIADVSRYIEEDSAIWEETLGRGISVYPPGCVNPMLHEYLSNGICSLIPEEDRYTVSTIIKTDDTGKVIESQVVDTVINNKKRMTYSKVNKYLEENIITPGYENFTSTLDSLYNEAMKVKNNMLENGFLEFSSDEVKYIFENNLIVNIKENRNGKAEQLIEFLALIHNITMTKYCTDNNLPLIFRVCEKPSSKKLIAWNDLLKQRGYDVDYIKKYTIKDIKERQRLYANSKEKVVLDSIAIRSQSKAKYSSNSIGHYPLGLGAYATFSSPIRRLADFINQRVYKDSKKYGNEYAKNKWEKVMPYLAYIATDSEIRADKAERRINDIRNCEYMSRFIGMEYECIVAETTASYIKVLIPNNMLYGKIYLDRKDYHLSKDGFSIVDNNQNRILVGDIINAKLVKSSRNIGEIELERSFSKEYINDKEKSKEKIKKR